MRKNDLHHGDALTVLRSLPTVSVDAVVTDPPYYRVKANAWDRQWDTAAGYLAWLDDVLSEPRRVLKPNGSLYLFASPQMAASVQDRVRGYFRVLNEIVWVKREGTYRRQCAERLRCYHPQTERIIFAEHDCQDRDWSLIENRLRGDVFEPLRLWLTAEVDRAGWDANALNRICGTRSMAGRHYTTLSQWALPTEIHYRALQASAPPGVLTRPYDCLRREYERLRAEFEAKREEAERYRRPFQLTGRVAMTDVWEFDTVSYRPGKHPCEKPLPLMQHILSASVRPGGIVLDPFLGSGTTGVAAKQGGFGFIGVEQDAAYFETARARIEAA